MLRHAWCLSVLAVALLAGCAPPRPAEPAAPAPSVAPAPPPVPRLHFVVYGDCRSRPDKHREVAQQIVKARPEVVFQTGDLVGDGSQVKLWEQAVEIVAPIREFADYYPAMGNHEEGVPDIEAYFDLPVAEAGQTYYTVERANCLFIVLDTTTLRLSKGDEPQMTWLQGVLAKQKQAPKDHVFVLMHHPPYSIGAYAPGDQTVRRRLHPLFLDAGVRAVFSGHDHYYYRTEREGVPYLISAGGGAPLYDPDPKLAQDGDKYVKSLHFVDLHVEGDTVSATAIDEQGQTIDTFELSDKAPTP